MTNKSSIKFGIFILLSMNISCIRDVGTERNIISYKRFNKDNSKIFNLGIHYHNNRPVINFQSTYKVDFLDSVNNLTKTEIVRLSVFDSKWKADTNQYLIAWRIIKKQNNKFIDIENQNSYTGVLSNKSKIFLHPIRDIEYKKLELAPFPLIEFNKKQWEYNIDIGEQWSSSGIIWNGNATFKIKYSLIGNRKFEINKSEIICKEVFATCVSDFSTSKLHFLYSDKYGFVELHYFNVDKTEMIFTLID